VSGRVILPQLATGDLARGSGVWQFGPGTVPETGWIAQGTGLNFAGGYTGKAACIASDGSVFFGGQAVTAGINRGYAAKFDASGALQWQIARGAAVGIGSVFTDCIVDAAGDLIVTGSAARAGNPQLASVMKFNGTTGAVIWTRSLASNSWDPFLAGAADSGLSAVAIDGSGDIYACTTNFLTGPGSPFSRAAVVMKIDPAGGLVWQRWISVNVGADTYGYGIAALGNRIAVCGYSPGCGAWIQEIDPAGNPVNAVALNNFNGEVFFGCNFDSAGNLYAAGQVRRFGADPGAWTVKFDASLALQWQRELTVPGSSCAAYRIGINGAGTQVSSIGNGVIPPDDTLAVSTRNAATGAVVWQRYLAPTGGIGQSLGQGIAVDAAGQCAIAGDCTPLSELISARLPSDGTAINAYPGGLSYTLGTMVDAAATIPPAAPLTSMGVSAIGSSASNPTMIGAISFAWTTDPIP
jgi:hypothetical protein